MTVADFFWFLVSSSGFVVLVAAAAIWLWVRPQSRRARAFLSVITTVFALASYYPLPRTVARLIANDFHPLTLAEVPPGKTVIVLLGSGTRTRRDWSDRSVSVLDAISLARMLEAARVFHLVKADFVISSGGKFGGDPNEPAGATMYRGLIELHVPPEQVIVERESRTTREQGVIVSKLLAPLQPKNVVLVTSPIHMRRAIGVFRAAGVTAIPAISREPLFTSWNLTWLPSAAGLGLSALVVHELTGLLYYRARGWHR